MTDEEKKAIESLIEIREFANLSSYKDTKINQLNAIEIVLNLIEKQTKEIEHQKEKRENQKQELAILNEKQKEFNKLVNTVNSYKGQFKRQQKEIEELKDSNNKLAQCHFKYEEMTGVDLLLPDKLEYISKKELEQKEKEAYIDGTNIADKLCNKKWEDKIKAKIEEVKDGTYDAKIVLQSLLEKE